jgi:hypothetical protein
MAADELSDDAPEVLILDTDNVPITYVDWFITGGPANPKAPVLNLVLGTVDHSQQTDEGPMPVVIGAKLRFTREFGTALHNILGEILAGHKPPKGQMN